MTEESRVSEVLDEGSTVICHRADAEAAGAPLPEFPSREEVEDLFGKFRAQVAPCYLPGGSPKIGPFI